MNEFPSTMSPPVPEAPPPDATHGMAAPMVSKLGARGGEWYITKSGTKRYGRGGKSMGVAASGPGAGKSKAARSKGGGSKRSGGGGGAGGGAPKKMRVWDPQKGKFVSEGGASTKAPKSSGLRKKTTKTAPARSAGGAGGPTKKAAPAKSAGGAGGGAPKVTAASASRMEARMKKAYPEAPKPGGKPKKGRMTKEDFDRRLAEKKAAGLTRKPKPESEKIKSGERRKATLSKPMSREDKAVEARVTKDAMRKARASSSRKPLGGSAAQGGPKTKQALAKKMDQRSREASESIKKVPKSDIAAFKAATKRFYQASMSLDKPEEYNKAGRDMEKTRARLFKKGLNQRGLERILDELAQGK